MMGAVATDPAGADEVPNVIEVLAFGVTDDVERVRA
jgi:hypothetical protein